MSPVPGAPTAGGAKRPRPDCLSSSSSSTTSQVISAHRARAVRIACARPRPEVQEVDPSEAVSATTVSTGASTGASARREERTRAITASAPATASPTPA